jgi:hypothetical protein
MADPFWLPTKRWLIVTGATALVCFASGGAIGRMQVQQTVEHPEPVVLVRNVPGPPVPGPTVTVPESAACKDAAASARAFEDAFSQYTLTIGQLRNLLLDASKATFAQNQKEMNKLVEKLDTMNRESDKAAQHLAEARTTYDKKMKECEG